MAVSFVVLYNCLVRGLIVQPAGSLYEQRPSLEPELAALEPPASSSSIQLFSCLYGVREIPGDSSPVADINADRRISFAFADDFNQINNQLPTDYQSTYEVPNSPADTEILSVYPASTAGTLTQRLPPIHTTKRNCHIIKCPKFSHATYGSDGGRCYEFANQCFMAVASCKRHNNRLPRLKEVSKKHCDKLIREITV
ncbi:uncharacterized protein LOC111601467 [Drosophila hydei]|uniref:Uncharacterized protein LOC111601467 n=1 Tax=Drosophila hydei TaxID=7224 RepID=A0A6J1LZE8_DROHY|nr:uncharacterized protein LOC111601467 [Drosophila hydei]